jgi:hypothetical protein
MKKIFKAIVNFFKRLFGISNVDEPQTVSPMDDEEFKYNYEAPNDMPQPSTNEPQVIENTEYQEPGSFEVEKDNSEEPKNKKSNKDKKIKLKLKIDK